MEPETAQRTIVAFEKAFNQKLKDVPVTINDKQIAYQVVGIKDGFLNVKQLNASGQPTGGGTQLPCSDLYLGLVLDQWIGGTAHHAGAGR